MGVTAQEAAISAMVNWRASYMRWAFPISSGVILGFRPPLRPRARAAASPAGVRSRMRAASYSAIRANIPNTTAPCAVVVSTSPLLSDRTPTPRACRVVTMSMRSRRLRPSRSIRQIGEAGRPLRPVGLRAAGPVGVDLQAVLGGERVELQLRVLVRTHRTRPCRMRRRGEHIPDPQRLEQLFEHAQHVGVAVHRPRL